MSMEITTRADAVKLGMKAYYTGVPCRNGHTALRYTRSGTCSACQSVQNDKWRGMADVAAETRHRGFQPLIVLVHRDDEKTVQEFVEALKLARTITA